MKKVLYFLLILSSAILFNGCSNKDDEVEFEISGENLKQTVWKGEYVLYEYGEGTYKCKINLFFTTETEGRFIETYPDNSSDSHGIKYTADKNMISIERTSSSLFLSGEWIVVEKSENKLVLMKNMGYEPFNFVMKISRVD